MRYFNITHFSRFSFAQFVLKISALPRLLEQRCQITPGSECGCTHCFHPPAPLPLCQGGSEDHGSAGGWKQMRRAHLPLVALPYSMPRAQQTLSAVEQYC